MRIKQWTWVAAVLVTLSTLGCGGTPAREDISVDTLEEKAAAGATINTKGMERKLEKKQAGEGAQEESAQ